MLYTLGNVRELVAPFVLTGGSCPDTVTVRNRINEAIRRLLTEGRADWVQTQRKIRLKTDNGCVTLPREFESARIASIDSGPANLFPYNYQYLEWGPWFEASEEHTGLDLMDEGDGWPCFFDVPSGDDCPDYFLYAVSTSFSDNGKKIIITGRDQNGNEILQSSGIPGEELAMSHWSNGVEGSLHAYPEPLSVTSFKAITSVKLPEGRKGYVSFYAVNPLTHEMFFLSKYHPDETIPGYRRYRLLGAQADTIRTVDMICKVRYTPATRDDDVLLIQNPDAIKTMVMAIREENAGNVQVSMALEEKANAQLARQTVNNRSADPILRVQDHFAMSAYPNMI